MLDDEMTAALDSAASHHIILSHFVSSTELLKENLQQLTIKEGRLKFHLATVIGEGIFKLSWPKEWIEAPFIVQEEVKENGTGTVICHDIGFELVKENVSYQGVEFYIPVDDIEFNDLAKLMGWDIQTILQWQAVFQQHQQGRNSRLRYILDTLFFVPNKRCELAYCIKEKLAALQNEINEKEEEIKKMVAQANPALALANTIQLLKKDNKRSEAENHLLSAKLFLANHNTKLAVIAKYKGQFNTLFDIWPENYDTLSIENQENYLTQLQNIFTPIAENINALFNYLKKVNIKNISHNALKTEEGQQFSVFKKELEELKNEVDELSKRISNAQNKFAIKKAAIEKRQNLLKQYWGEKETKGLFPTYIAGRANKYEVRDTLSHFAAVFLPYTPEKTCRERYLEQTLRAKMKIFVTIGSDKAKSNLIACIDTGIMLFKPRKGDDTFSLRPKLKDLKEAINQNNTKLSP